MTEGRNRDAARRMLRAMDTGVLDDAAEYIDPDYRNAESEDHPGRDELAGPEEFRATVSWLRNAFSRLHFEEQDLVAEGDHVVVETVMSGVHTGSFLHLQPTGRSITQRQTHWLRVRDGRVVAHHAQRDDLGLLLQLGATPGTTRPD